MIDQLKKKLGEEAEKLQHELNVVLPRDTQSTQLVARIADVEGVAEVRWDD